MSENVRINYGTIKPEELNNLRKAKFDLDTANAALNRVDFPNSMNEKLIILYYKAALEHYTDAEYIMSQNNYNIRSFFKIDNTKNISIDFDTGDVYSMESEATKA